MQVEMQTQLCLLGCDQLEYYRPGSPGKRSLLLRLRSTCVNSWLCHLPVLP